MIRDLWAYARTEPRDFLGGCLLWVLLLGGVWLLLGMQR